MEFEVKKKCTLKMTQQQKSYRYPLATSSWDEDEYAALTRVIHSDMFSMGPEVEKYEQCFAAYFGSKYAVMVNSGSSANLLMTAALFFTTNEKTRLKAGDEIIVPAVSWPTTYYPLSQYGLTQKFVDVDRNTLNYDLDQLQDAITNQTKAIMLVNLLGNPNDFDAINSMTAGRDIILIEDNCESMGAKYKGRFTGTFGLTASFSSFFHITFQPWKEVWFSQIMKKFII